MSNYAQSLVCSLTIFHIYAALVIIMIHCIICIPKMTIIIIRNTIIIMSVNSRLLFNWF